MSGFQTVVQWACVSGPTGAYELHAMKCQSLSSLLRGLPLSVVRSAAAETVDRIRRRGAR
jgi:hypothetical protein